MGTGAMQKAGCHEGGRMLVEQQRAEERRSSEERRPGFGQRRRIEMIIVSH